MDDNQLREELIPKDPQQSSCALCNNNYPIKDLLSTSENCQHGFCFQCLLQRLQDCLLEKQDMKCPNDACFHPLSDSSKFFHRIPKNIHDKYILWKNSSNYRPPSYRRSFFLNSSISDRAKQQSQNKLIQKQQYQERMEQRPQIKGLIKQKQEDQRKVDNEEQMPERVAERNEVQRNVKQPLLVIVFRVFISLVGLVGLILLSSLFTLLCFLIYFFCALFIFLVIASLAGIVFFIIKEMYFPVIMLALILVFSLVVSRFYAANFTQINEEIIKKGCIKLGIFFKKVVEFPHS